MSNVTRTTRHNLLRDATARCLSRHGISCKTEPRTYQYEDTSTKRRPDLVAYLDIPVVTDFSIVKPRIDIGHAAELKEKEKNDIHLFAILSQEHRFHPCVWEAFGHPGKSVNLFIDAITKQLPKYMRYPLRQALIYEMSTAIQKGLTATVLAIASPSFDIL